MEEIPSRKLEVLQPHHSLLMGDSIASTANDDLRKCRAALPSEQHGLHPIHHEARSGLSDSKYMHVCSGGV